MAHLPQRTLLLTGAAGFIGHHLSLRLLAEGYAVVGTDNLMADDNLVFKTERLRQLERQQDFVFRRLDLNDGPSMERLFEDFSFHKIVHLGARTGVRPSLLDPLGYLDANVRGTGAVLDLAREHAVPHVIFASSSSVYGDSPEQPFSEDQPANRPISVYAATKKSAEPRTPRAASKPIAIVTRRYAITAVSNMAGRPRTGYGMEAEGTRIGNGFKTDSKRIGRWQPQPRQSRQNARMTTVMTSALIQRRVRCCSSDSCASSNFRAASSAGARFARSSAP